MTSVIDELKIRRKNWYPIAPEVKEICVEGAEDAISRALAIRALELPVKSFILEGLSKQETKDLGEDVVSNLLTNTEDEERHDIALNNCANAFAYYNPKYEAIVQQMLSDLKALPDEPILKTAILERGIFFVILPFFRQFGGDVLRRTSQDISFDESNHVKLHSYVSETLNQKASKQLNSLRKAIVAWIFEDFNLEGRDKNFWVKASSRLLKDHVAPELEFTQAATMLGFFETRNDQLSLY